MATKKGVALSSGESGFFPYKNIERSAETDTWTLHKSHLFISKPAQEATTIKQEQQTIQVHRTKSSSEKAATKSTSSNTNEIKSLIKAISISSENSFMQTRYEVNPERSLPQPGLLRFFFARHGERVDLTFGAQWLEQAFDRTGKYRRVNLNMPTSLPVRASKREFVGKQYFVKS